MNGAVRRLGLFLNDECYAMVVLGAEVKEIAVFRAGLCVASIPLTETEFTYLVEDLGDTQQMHPISYFYLALQKGYLNSLS